MWVVFVLLCVARKIIKKTPLFLWLITLFIFFVILPCLTGNAFAAEPMRTQANVPVEITFIAQRPHTDPFNDVTLDVQFTAPDKTVKTVPAFWAGGTIWKVRYSSALTGVHRWRSVSSDTQDAGLQGATGVVEVTPYRGSNPLFKHGPVRVAANRRHFEYADGTPFFWLGDTWWMGLCHRLHFPDEFKQLAADRKAKGFNVIQIVAGLYPDMFPFDPRGANEAGFPVGGRLRTHPARLLRRGGRAVATCWWTRGSLSAWSAHGAIFCR